MSLKLKTFACAVVLVGLAAVLAIPQRAAAQDGDDPPSRVARMSYLQGSISFQPAGESEWATATINRPMTTGDKLWSDQDSRAEVHLGSAVIRLSSDTGFSFLNLDDRTVQIQLSAGALYVRVRHLDRDEIFEVDTPNQAFSILRAGEYRFDASEDGTGTRIAVREGEGEATGGDRTYTVERGEQATLSGTDSLSANIDTIERDDRDDFDEWCEIRDQREERSRSARYVSPDLVGYEDLDENGVWRNDEENGEVWIPTTVPAGWAPYHYGHWNWISPWGWTWVDEAPWGYAPFHYGRWAYTRSGWAWVPGPVNVKPVYAPALVAFVGTPNFAVGIGMGGGTAVAWFPLGPREVYVPSYPVSREYVDRVNVSNTAVNSVTVTNVYNTTIISNNTQVTRINYVNRRAPGAITVVPDNAFRSAQPVDRSAVRVNERELADARVIPRAQVAPTRNSLLGASESEGVRHAPPRAIAERPVVAKTTPPPPPVSFDRQAAALAAHPGEPLRHGEAETLRPANAESAHPMIRQLPGREAEVDRGRPQSQPDRGASRAIANRPTNTTPPEMPQNGPRNDRPGSAQPEYRGHSDQAQGEPRYQPTKEQPGYAPPSNAGEKETGQAVRPASEPSNVPPRSEPAQTPEQSGKRRFSFGSLRNLRSNPQQPDTPANRGDSGPTAEPRRGATPNPSQSQPSDRPALTQTPERSDNQPPSLPVRELRPNPEAPSAPANRRDSAPIPEPRREATPNLPQAQPSYRPAPPQTFEQPGNRPSSLPAPRGQSASPQSQNSPANHAVSPAVPEPRREATPPQPPAAAPRPAPTAAAPAPPTRNESRPEAKRAIPAPPAANQGGNGPAHGNKDEKKKN